MRRATRILLTLALTLMTAAFGIVAPTASASADQLGVEQITINPGGGVNADGSDGVRFTINSDGVRPLWWSGPDVVDYRGTTQYCCTGAAPLLNIGGLLFGQGGPAYDGGNRWTSLTILSTSGSAVTGTRTAATGDASVTVRYLAQKNGLDYLVDRTVSYVYPNNHVTDSYSFVIPAGNTETVKFYYGGDAAPGNSDGAYGVMLTEPVRSVISLNRDSEIMVGYREVPGSRPFDGARSADYYVAYPMVGGGQDIGFAVDTNYHDAGLMMQWTLGSTPGTYTAAMGTFASEQGVDLSASVSTSSAITGTPFTLDFAVLNTSTASATDVGFDFTIPTGLALGGIPVNGCAGTIATTGSTVSLSGGTLGPLGNCVVSVPLVAASTGTYTISGADVTVGSGLTNAVGTYPVTVNALPVWQTAAFDKLVFGTAFSQQLVAEGSGTIDFSVVGGTLPAGLTLSATGVLSGTPEQAGPYSVTVRASSSFGTVDEVFVGTVDKGATAISAAPRDVTIEFGETVTLQPLGLPASATGIVRFVAGTVELCQVDAASGDACTTSATLPAGSYNVQVQYSGDDNWLSSSQSAGSITVAALPAPVAPAAPATPAGLATTGADVSPWLLGGIALGGVGMLLIATRLAPRFATRRISRG